MKPRTLREIVPRRYSAEAGRSGDPGTIAPGPIQTFWHPAVAETGGVTPT